MQIIFLNLFSLRKIKLCFCVIVLRSSLSSRERERGLFNSQFQRVRLQGDSTASKHVTLHWMSAFPVTFLSYASYSHRQKLLCPTLLTLMFMWSQNWLCSDDCNISVDLHSFLCPSAHRFEAWAGFFDGGVFKRNQVTDRVNEGWTIHLLEDIWLRQNRKSTSADK